MPPTLSEKAPLENDRLPEVPATSNEVKEETKPTTAPIASGPALEGASSADIGTDTTKVATHSTTDSAPLPPAPNQIKPDETKLAGTEPETRQTEIIETETGKQQKTPTTKPKTTKRTTSKKPLPHSSQKKILGEFNV